jgi:CheY-like chemotaxis protein
MQTNTLTPADTDARPEFRVAVFGLATRFQQLLEIVLRHARHNRYRFSLAASHGPGKFDLALVDMTAQGGPRVFDALTRLVDRDAVIRVGRRTDPSRQTDELLVHSFVAQVLFELNRAVDSRLGRGAKRRPEGTPPEPGLRVADSGLIRRPRVIVVDGSPTVRRQLATALHQIGIDSEGFGSAGEALRELELRRYEGVLTEVELPDMDGYRLIRMIRRNRSLRNLPVVFLTRRASPLDLARGALAGCNSYLEKPVMQQSLHDTMLRLLARFTQRAGEPLQGLSGKAIS